MIRIDDYECKDCGHTQEVFTNTSSEDKPVCEKCKSINLQKVLAVGTGSKTHSSWGKWKV